MLHAGIIKRPLQLNSAGGPPLAPLAAPPCRHIWSAEYMLGVLLVAVSVLAFVPVSNHRDAHYEIAVK